MPIRPSEHEDQYFAKLELERRRGAEAERREAALRAEREERRQRHHLKCPKCGDDLSPVDRGAVQIDRCPSCSGIWLDAGELEAIVTLERSALRRLFSVFRR